MFIPNENLAQPPGQKVFRVYFGLSRFCYFEMESCAH